VLLQLDWDIDSEFNQLLTHQRIMRFLPERSQRSYQTTANGRGAGRESSRYDPKNSCGSFKASHRASGSTLSKSLLLSTHDSEPTKWHLRSNIFHEIGLTFSDDLFSMAPRRDGSVQTPRPILLDL
jgi:hypothetical protein